MNSEILGTRTSAFTGVVFAQQIKQGLKFNYNQIEDIEFIRNDKIESPEAGLEPMTAVISFKANTGDGGLDVRRIEGVFNRDTYYSDHARVPDGGLSYRTYQSKGIALRGAGLFRCREAPGPAL